MKLKRYLIFIIVLFFGCFISLADASIQAPVDITKMSIADIKDAFDKGYLNSELLVKLYLERIETYDSLFNSINQINPNAIEEAKILDQERVSGNSRGRLHGIPILVKTNIDVKGLATTAGSKALKDNYPKENAFVVQKLVDEGAIILGSTNMSEFAFMASNSFSSYGYVKNVYNTGYSSYGSSGGSAVSLGAAFAAATLGTDTNASVRVPAAANGVIGIRPTFGSVSRSGVLPYDPNRDIVGVMSKTVQDNSLILDVISGKDAKDSATNNAISYDSNNYNSNYSTSGVRVGIITNFFKGIEGAGLAANQVTDSDIYNLSEQALAKFKESGVELVYIDQFLTAKYNTIANNTMSGILMCDSFNSYIQGTTGHIRSFEQLYSNGGYVQNLSGYIGGCGSKYQYKEDGKEKDRQVYRDYTNKFFEDNNIDVIAYPTLKTKIIPYNGSGIKSPSSSISSAIGYPAISVPMGKIGGFSYSIEFMGKPYQEATLYNIAGIFERANGNVVESSSLTPSLYTIPESVEQLKAIYENEDLNSVEYQDLKQEMKLFFESYSTNEQVSDQAVILINKYEEKKKTTEKEDNGIVSNISKDIENKFGKKVGKVLLTIIKVGLILIGILVFLCVILIIRKKIRRYKRRKSRRRK